MSTYTIIEYTDYRNLHKVKSDFDGSIMVVDLFVDSSFKNSPVKDGISIEERDAICKSMVGIKVEIDELYPCEYIASGVEIIK